jgi:AcrR family transcriptional regulator
MDAASALLAEGGEGSVSLREIAEAAEANVAAVSYHFGSLRSLCDAAIEDALERYLDAQQQAVSELDPGSTLEQAAAAFARPMMYAMSVGGRDLAVMRICARTSLEPPASWARFSDRFEGTRIELVGVLKARLPDVSERELIFRTRCVAGLLNWLALAPVGQELRGKSLKQIERRLVPLLAGIFRGSGP